MAWTPKNKNTSVFTGQSKTASAWDKGVGYLLQEIGDYILQENGGKIILQESWAVRNKSTWTAQSKS